MINFITVLRFIAVILITNSHFDGVYPLNISWGGAPGVSLFFMITGFLLAGINNETKFNKWYWKKLIRLYVPLTIVNIVTLAIGFRNPVDIVEYVQLFIFPISIDLWYAPAISLLYIPYFIMLKWMRKYVHILAFAIICLYFVRYFSGYDLNIFFVEPKIEFRCMYGFICMLIGMKLREVYNDNKVCSITDKKSHHVEIIMCVGCVCGFLVTKLLLEHSAIIMKLQFMTQVFSIAFAYFAFRSCMYYEIIFQLYKSKNWYKTVKVVSDCSLEIYFIQFVIIAYLKHLFFPFNIVLIILALIVFGMMVHKISEFIIKSNKFINKLSGTIKVVFKNS